MVRERRQMMTTTSSQDPIPGGEWHEWWRKYPMGSCYSFTDQAGIFCNSGGRCDESRSLDCFLAVQVEIVIRVFAILHLLENGINGRFLESLFPIHSIYHLFSFWVTFAGSGKVGNKVQYTNHICRLAGRGGEERLSLLAMPENS
jgi:hypothetical protein